MRFVRRWLLGSLAVLLLLGAMAWLTLRASLPILEGVHDLSGLDAAVLVERDALGTVTIVADHADDMARALGFVHAQERFFQMDLLRRSAAGELSELVGAAALPLDRRHRVHRFRARAEAAIAALPSADRSRILAYTDGVNQGLAALSLRPWEYLLLRAPPAPWRNADSALVVYAMYFDLNGDGANRRELDLARMRAVLPQALVDFLVQPGSRWDAPLSGPALPARPLPGADLFDLGNAALASTAAPVARLGPQDLGQLPGSNQFAVAGSRGLDGAAWLANDMHLHLGVPNIWFRARLRFADASGRSIDLNGLTLPGAPALIAGSNGRIAWGYTNSYGDWADWVRVHRDPNDTRRYLTADGSEALTVFEERIRVKGGSEEILRIEETRWGPFLANDTDGTPLALAWTAHLPRALNFRLLQLEQADDAAEALALAPTFGMPAQNFMVADRAGAIGWTLTGNALRVRIGFDAQSPADFSDPAQHYGDWLNAKAFPRLSGDDAVQLWTANARTQHGAALALVGDGGYDLGARAQQIRDGLEGPAPLGAAELLAIQLDDRALFLAHWQRLLDQVLARAPADRLAALRAASGDWDGRASVDSVAYRLVRAFRLNVIEAALAPFEQAVKARFADFSLPSAQGYEAPVWALLQARPAHLLAPQYADWDALLLTAAERVQEELGAAPGGLAARSWGERNTSAIRHPLSAALPAWFRPWLDMPAEALPGDANMPRVQGPEFGASERFVIAPGREAESYLMMPGGQSAHPLSPFHRAGHADWAAGRPTPLLPGPGIHHLRLSAATQAQR
ncbi:MAG: penicillin acylase family protein [Lysobacterales bacterium]